MDRDEDRGMDRDRSVLEAHAAGVPDEVSCRGDSPVSRTLPRGLVVQDIHSLDGIVELEGEWRRLQDEAGILPFTSWEWSVTWWRHLSRQSLVVSDRLFLKVFRGPDGALIAVAPLMLREYPARGPRFRSLRYLGADPGFTEVRGLLCRQEHEAGVHAALVGDLFARDRLWECLMLEGIRSTATLSRLAELHGEPVQTEVTPCFLLTLPESWEAFRATRSRNVKESLRKCANSLKRAGLVPVHRVASTGPELMRALESFFTLHTARANRSDTVPHTNVFDTPLARSFLRALVVTYASSGAVRIFTMDLEGQTVAARIAFVVGRSLYLYYSGYDPAFGRYSVMTSVVAHAIQYAIGQGYETVNLSTGNDPSKARWSPEETCFTQVVLHSTSLRGRVGTAAYLYLRERWLALDRVNNARRGAR
jgi:CelD/BcsL family acetyltransferase involved in cellulose biosynthesis